MPVIRVKKPFVFSYMGEGQRVATTRDFPVGDHEVPDEIFDHPWISTHLADGKIESPAETKARVQRMEADAKQAAQEAEVATKAAQASFARLKAAEPNAKASAAEIQKELNTPVKEIQGKRAGVT